MKTVRHDETGTQLEIGVVDILVGARYVIAIGQSSPDALEGASERLRTRPEVATHGPMAAAWAVLAAVIDDSERVVDGLGDQLERVQVAVFQDDQDQSEPIYLQLREAARLARAMHPMLAILDRLERGELEEVPQGLSPLLGDVSDHARHLSEEVTMLGEALDGLLNANLARVTVRQNVIIQQVSAWAAIAAVATIITGIYGMNFRHMPELDWIFGYPMAIAIMVLTSSCSAGTSSAWVGCDRGRRPPRRIGYVLPGEREPPGAIQSTCSGAPSGATSVVRPRRRHPVGCLSGADLAIALDGRPDEPLGVGGIRDVGLHVHRVGQPGRELLAFGHRRHRVDHDAGTEFGERGGDGGADPARRAGDEGDAALQVAHDWWRGEAMGWWPHSLIRS